MNSHSVVESEPPENWKRKLLAALLCIAMASLASLPFFVIGEDQKVGCCGGEMPVTHDAWMHFNQMQAFARGLASGRVYPRWDDATHDGYGAPTTSFYPPGIYYLTSAFYFPRRDWRWAWIGFYWTAMAASTLASYAYARRTMRRGGALIAAAVYAFAPYHLLNQYQRGAMGEFIAFVWMPLLLQFAEELLETGGTGSQPVPPVNGTDRLRTCPTRSAAGLAAGFGAFLWTHPPTAYQFTLVFGACLATRAAMRRQWRELAIVACALVFGSMLAAAYFHPAIAEQHLVNYDDIERTWPYHASYVYDFSQQVYDRASDPFFARIDRIWAFNLAMILIGAVVPMWRGDRRQAAASGSPLLSRPRSLTLPVLHRLTASQRLWIAAGLLASFLMTKLSMPIGRWIPKIEIGVFSWRMLALSSLSMALLAGACFDRAGRVIPKAVASLMLFATAAMSFWHVVWPMARGQAFEPNPAHYNYATLPRGAPREVPPMAPAQTASGNGRVTIDRWMPEERRLRVELDEDDRLQFRTSNFAGWTATVDGRIVAIEEGASRNIVIDVPAGEHRVALEFRSTPVRRASNWITVVSFAWLISALISMVMFRWRTR
jgi:hypothetical protein